MWMMEEETVPFILEVLHMYGAAGVREDDFNKKTVKAA